MVTFITTAPTLSEGMPARPLTCRSRVDCAIRAPVPANAPSFVEAPLRVSRMRAGDTGFSSDAAGNQPTTSAIKSVEPAELKIDTDPLPLARARTRFGRVWPATKLTFDASGR